MQAAVCELRAAPEAEFAGLAHPCCVSDRKEPLVSQDSSQYFFHRLRTLEASEEGFSPALGGGEPLHFWTVSL